MAAPIGPKKVHRYTVEFKIHAVRLSLHPDIQTQDVAHALDIHPFMLSKWKKDYREGKLKAAAGAAGLSLPKLLQAPKRDPEKRALRRQVKQLEAKVEARRAVRALERKPRSKIKVFLHEPKNVVGIGNIYSDETCFYARVRPQRLAKSLKRAEIHHIYAGIRQILTAAIKHKGTTYRNYVQTDGQTGNFYDHLQVYQRFGQQCYRCKHEITKIKLGGRTASYCPHCQK